MDMKVGASPVRCTTSLSLSRNPHAVMPTSSICVSSLLAGVVYQPNQTLISNKLTDKS